jgi:uncharacterized protein (TIGR01777 family)
MATIIITGGTGLIGTALTNYLLAQDHSVIILSRESKASAQKNLSYVKWNVNDHTISPSAISQTDVIIHLAGANVAEKRWTAKRKKEIIESRVKSGELIARSLKKLPHQIHTVISASGIGYYGDNRDSQKAFTETDPPGKDFLASVCQQWESAIEPVQENGLRLVILRFGLIFSRKGGAYAAFRKPFQYSLSAVFGKGEQVMSWLHIEDCVRMIMYAIDSKNLSGEYNAVSPHPVTNKELNYWIGKVTKKNTLPLKMPESILKLVLGGVSAELLKSANVSCQKIEDAGFQYRYPTVRQAIENLEAVKP